MSQETKPAPSPFSTPIIGSSQSCMQCGSSNREDANFCWCCGFSFRGQQAVVHAARGGSTGLRIVLFAILVPLSLVGATVIGLFVVCIASISGR